MSVRRSIHPTNISIIATEAPATPISSSVLRETSYADCSTMAPWSPARPPKAAKRSFCGPGLCRCTASGSAGNVRINDKQVLKRELPATPTTSRGVWSPGLIARCDVDKPRDKLKAVLSWLYHVRLHLVALCKP